VIEGDAAVAEQLKEEQAGAGEAEPGEGESRDGAVERQIAVELLQDGAGGGRGDDLPALEDAADEHDGKQVEEADGEERLGVPVHDGDDAGEDQRGDQQDGPVGAGVDREQIHCFESGKRKEEPPSLWRAEAGTGRRNEVGRKIDRSDGEGSEAAAAIRFMMRR